MQDSAIKHNSAPWNFLSTGVVVLNMLEALNKTFLIFPTDQAGCFHMGINVDED